MADDIKELYNVLLQEFETLKLETQLYKKEIHELRQENSNLKETGDFHRKESIRFTKDTAPMLKSSLQSLSVALEHAELSQELSIAENTEYQDIIQELQDENATMKQRITQYERAVDVMQENQNKQKLESENRIAELQQTIVMLSKENSDILQEYQQQSAQYDALQTSTDTQLQQQMEASEVRPVLQNDQSVHITFTASLPRGKLGKYSSKPDLAGNESGLSLPGLQLLDNPSNDARYKLLQTNMSAASVFSIDEEAENTHDTLINKVKELEGECQALRKRIAMLVDHQDRSTSFCFGWKF